MDLPEGLNIIEGIDIHNNKDCVVLDDYIDGTSNQKDNVIRNLNKNWKVLG